MRKKYALIIILFFIYLHSFSQNELFVGVNTGSTHLKLRGNNFIGQYKPKIDYFVGGFFEFKLSTNLSVLMNVNYERKTINNFYPKLMTGDNPIVVIGTPIGETPVEQEEPKFESVIKFQYISFPVLIRYYPLTNTPFYLNIGPYFAYSLDISNYIDGTKNDLDFNNGFKQLDTGISSGLGYEFQINGTNYLGVELRNNLGLKNLSKYTNSPLNSTKSNTFSIIISYKLKI